MRVLVDTSVWADFLNGHPSPEAGALARLIREEADLLTCGLVAAEVLQGIRRTASRRRIKRHFLDMDWLTPTEPDTYLAAADLFRTLRRRDVTVRSLVDCLVAQLAHEHDTLLLFKDRDLERIVESRVLGIRAVAI